MNTQESVVSGDLNQALVEYGLVRPQPMMAPPERVARGKGYVNVQRFSTTGSASAVKAALKAADPKLSSKALSRKVNETLRGERDLRCQLAIAWVTGRFAEGDVPSHGEVSSNGSVLRMRALPVEAPRPAAEPKQPETKEELEKALAELTAKLAAMK